MTTPRRRVVMIVDNHVDGDSRVQKVARSAAAAGWDVILLGRSRTTTVETSDLGGAEVRLVPVVSGLLGFYGRVPGRRWRFPLAYPSRELSTHRARELDALKARASERRASHKLHGASLPRRVVNKGLALRVNAAVMLHKVRNDQLRRAVQSHQSDGRIARTTAVVKHTLAPRTAWESLDPYLVDLALAYEPVLRKLKPDVIHAHDFRMIGIAVRVAEHRKARGHRCAVVYDAHEFLPGVRYRTRRWHVANESHESLYVPRADAVVTVSETLAEMLKARHELTTTPTVVLNAPALRKGAEPPRGGVRAVCGLAPEVPLLVYAGSPAPQRGLHTVVEALATLPGVHVAMLLPPHKECELLQERATSLGVQDRLHLLPYVDQDLVVPFLRSADVGLVPIHHVNHEIALITKYFDYALAGLPIVTSDVQTMADVTRRTGNGEVFEAEDVKDFTRAVQLVLSDPVRYRSSYTPEALEKWTWSAQERTLLALYDQLSPS